MTNHAKEMRSQMTRAETLLWTRLRDPLIGARFRRQARIGPYIADFAAFEPRLVVEADGGQHADNAYDEERDAWLKEQGFRVLRFWNHDVLDNIEGVLEVLQQAIEDLRNSD